jgi:hypothetical protein
MKRDIKKQLAARTDLISLSLKYNPVSCETESLKQYQKPVHGSANT